MTTPTPSPTSASSLSSKQQKAALELVRRTVLENPFIPHAPTKRQVLLLGLPYREMLFGGAAGGGKSDALLMAALQYVEVPGYSAILLRQSYKDLSLPGALMDRAAQWLGGTPAKWNGERKMYRFPSGARLVFGYLERPRDVYQYQGAEFHFIGMDELTQFGLFEYKYMHSRLRRLAGSRLPVRIFSASNPGGHGHEWVKQRFLLEPTADRAFIPSRLADNPYLDQVEYARTLEELDPVTRQQLLEGDWDVLEKGAYFDRVWFRAVDADRVPRLDRVVRFWDLASTRASARNRDPDWTVGTKMGLGSDGTTYMLGEERFRDTPQGVKDRIRFAAESDGAVCEVHIEMEGGASGKFTADEFGKLLSDMAYYPARVSGSKIDRARPFSAAAQRGDVAFVRQRFTEDYWPELEMFPDPRVHDDRVDSASGAYAALHSRRVKREERRRSSTSYQAY